MMSERRESGDGSMPRGWYRATGVGVEFAVAVAGGSALGWWLDGRLGTSPGLTIVGVFLGFGVGLWLLLRLAKDAFR